MKTRLQEQQTNDNLTGTGLHIVVTIAEHACGHVLKRVRKHFM